jgi:hypothetical protein
MCLRSKLPEALMARPDKETRKRLEGNRAPLSLISDSPRACSAMVVSAATVVFFLLAVFGYNPQRGMIRRAPQPA